MKRNDWVSDAEYRIKGVAPACWDCAHFRRQVDGDGASRHRCHIARHEFPSIGRHCKAYVYEPGADAAEYER